MSRDQATENQVQSADPRWSTWLSANAGSGKTRVLTDRVARLLLQGVSPQRILCLTFTKAAASEMQNRLFARLGSWSMLDDQALAERLTALGQDDQTDGDALRNARRLFARAIETPGGLKIQTIHSFCSALLRRFPLEAGVSPQFVELDEHGAKRLRESVLDQMADGPGCDALDGVAAYISDGQIDDLVATIAKNRARFDPPLDHDARRATFGLGPGDTESAIAAEVFLGQEQSLFRDLAALMRDGSITVQRAGLVLEQLAQAPLGFATLAELETQFLHYKRATRSEPFTAKIGAYPTMAFWKTLGALESPLSALMTRVEAARPRRLSLLNAERSWAMDRFAQAFLERYEAGKAQRGWLDFDDLILKTRSLLSQSDAAQWVLFRLDGWIDHILVDEAQDTSPQQWDIVDLLTREFTAGAGVRPGAARSLFVVGDQKQSIYSFQGADSDGFERMRTYFSDKITALGQPMQDRVLDYSFRSSPVILSLVDQVFQGDAARGLGRDVLHRAFWADMPGRVDLWPALPAQETEEPPEDWGDPVDLVSGAHPVTVLASQIADEIQQSIARRDPIWQPDGTTRPVRPGDFLILVQRRKELFHAVIRACKQAGLPIAGADRLRVGGELAVRDLVSLLSFLALPEDSLALAGALRSPLFGWDEARLYDLAAGRDEPFLWQALRNRPEIDPETVSILAQLRDSADFLRPYDLLMRILTQYRGRSKLIARLGGEAEDGIDALLQQALSYESLDVPDLTGFLSWLEADDNEIKRQPDTSGQLIRVMTVHGAKGLEAPIVILPETADRRVEFKDQILVPDDKPPAWTPKVDEMTPELMAARQVMIDKQTEERRRLLYVAMTRAEQRLIICGAGHTKSPDCWYNLVAAGMRNSGAVKQGFANGDGLRLELGVSDPVSAQNAANRDVHAPARPDLPDWAHRPAGAPVPGLEPVSPSALGGAKALASSEGLDEAAAMARGDLVHLLLELLPDCDPAQRDTLGAQVLSTRAPDLSAKQRSDILDEVLAVLAAPALEHVFAPGSLAEVDITAPMKPFGNRPLNGRIDRLVVTGTHVLAVDFKTNRAVPQDPNAVPDGLLRQMATYGHALEQIYPGRAIDLAILWTRDATLMRLPPALLADALMRAARLDDGGGHT